MFRTEDTKYFLDALMHDGCIFDGQACCSCKDEGLFCFVQHYNEWDVSMWQIDMPDFVCLHLMLSQSRDCNDKNGRIYKECQVKASASKIATWLVIADGLSFEHSAMCDCGAAGT